MSTQTNLSAQKALAAAVLKIYERHHEDLARVKQEAIKNAADPAWLWEGLLRSAATWGSVRGIKLLEDPGLHDRVRWGVLENMPDNQRQSHIEHTLAGASLRMYKVKAEFLARNFLQLQAREA